MAEKKPHKAKPSTKPQRAQHTSGSKSKVSSSATGSRLRGQVAVITGATRGIGFAVANALVAQGASVVITGRDAKKVARSAQKIAAAVSTSSGSGTGRPRVIPQVCNVRDPQSVAALFEAIKQQFGAIDILVNNAGITQPTLSVEETSLELWRDVIETNLTGIFLCTRSALPLIREGGTIVNNISLAAKQTFPKFATYTASKHGALGFTLALREELIPRRIRVVALMPGATDTPLWDQLWPDARRDRMMDADSVAQAVLSAVLLPPTVNVSEIVLAPIGGAL